MTRRNFFSQCSPHIVNETFCRQFVPFYCTEQAFNICKGLKFIAQGKILDESDEVALKKTTQANPRLTTIQERVLVAGLKGYLNAACETLGFTQESNPDELINEWLDQTIPSDGADVNQLAANIISKLINDNLKRDERFQS